MMLGDGRTVCSIFIDLVTVKQSCWKQVSYKKRYHFWRVFFGCVAIWVLIRIWLVKVLKTLYS